MDNTSQVGSSWTSVYCSNGLLCGYITRVSLTAGEHRLYHQDPRARIGVSAYGFSYLNSYGYPGGLKLTSIRRMFLQLAYLVTTCNTQLFTNEVLYTSSRHCISLLPLYLLHDYS